MMNHLGQLYQAYGKSVYRIALHYVQNVEDAQEITQDVFVAIHDHLDEFRQEAQITTWIHRIAVNKCLDHLRFKNRKKRFAAVMSIITGEKHETEIPHFDHPGVAMESQEEMKKIFDAINELPEQQKTAIILMKLEGHSQQETAVIMNTSTKAVESLISRGKQKLREILSKDMDLNNVKTTR